MRVSAAGINRSILPVFFAALIICGCNQKNLHQSKAYIPGTVEPAGQVDSPQKQARPLPSPGNSETVQVVPSPIPTTSFKESKACESDFPVPFYPGAHIQHSSKTKGLSPLDRDIMYSIVEMYTMDTLEDVLAHYYQYPVIRKRKEINTEEGRKIIFSDNEGIPASPSRGRPGMTIVITGSPGRVTMVYTGFVQVHD